MTRLVRTHRTLEELNADLNSCSAIADRDLRLVKSRKKRGWDVVSASHKQSCFKSGEAHEDELMFVR